MATGARNVRLDRRRRRRGMSAPGVEGKRIGIDRDMGSAILRFNGLRAWNLHVQQGLFREILSALKEIVMNNIIWIIGAVVIVLVVLSFFGLR
ncbi:MAG TPA: hypothetical protein VFY63_17570 [Pseudorhizobium sp.]|nr:hypothetical protein [Pseudorhizobium sp.]